MDSWTIFKPRASRSRSRLRRQVSYDSVTENQCDGNFDFKKVVKVSKMSSLLWLPKPVNTPCSKDFWDPRVNFKMSYCCL